MEAFTFNTIELTLLAVAGVLFIIQLFYYLGLYNRIYSRNKAARNQTMYFNHDYPALSVIICARNEADNLRNFLPAILEQDYPEFEVIVINDASTDETEDVLTFLENKYTNLYHSFTPESARYISHKKLALTLGVKASKYDWLVFTETNCKPMSDQWLKLMARNFTPQTEVVLGYSGYEYAKGWTNRKIDFDNLFHSLRYLGLALAGKPYMGVGKNLAYRKELFFQKKGFSSFLNLQRGEDDLFVNQIANRNNTRVETDINSTIRIQSSAKNQIWKEEKISYTATARFFKGMQGVLFGFETFSRILLHATCIAGITVGIINKQWVLAGSIFFIWILRFLMQAIIINKVSKELDGKRRYYLSLPLFDILQPIQTLRFKFDRLFMSKNNFIRQ